MVAWAGSQKWEDYKLGLTVVETTIAGKSTVIGVGVSDVPENKMLIEPNQKRTVALALRAVRKKVDVISKDGLLAVVNDDFDLPNGIRRRIVVVASLK